MSLKIIVAGGRDFDDYSLAAGYLDEIIPTLLYLHGSLREAPTLVGGGARGADALGKRYAEENELTYQEFPADWDRLGRSAGMARNTVMAASSDALIAFWDGRSKGTKHMIDSALASGLVVHVERY